MERKGLSVTLKVMMKMMVERVEMIVYESYGSVRVTVYYYNHVKGIQLKYSL